MLLVVTADISFSAKSYFEVFWRDALYQSTYTRVISSKDNLFVELS